jgi:hypothetical protein
VRPRYAPREKVSKSATKIVTAAHFQKTEFLDTEKNTAKGRAIPRKKACMCGSGKKADARMTVCPEIWTKRLGYSITTDENEFPRKNGRRTFVHHTKSVPTGIKNCAAT